MCSQVGKVRHIDNMENLNQLSSSSNNNKNNKAKQGVAEIKAATKPSNAVESSSIEHPEIALLCELLQISSKNQCKAIQDFLYSFVGIIQEEEEEESSSENIKADRRPAGILENLAFLREEDLKNSFLPLATQRKLLIIINFLRKKGSFEIPAGKSLEGMMRYIEQSPKCDDRVVNLNVGGYQFTTSRDTLCRIKNSTLEAMFSCRFDKACEKDSNGAYFIDRNGEYFSFVLDYLRVGAVVSLPSDNRAKEALAIEADFYGLDDLVQAIRKPANDPADYIDEEMSVIRNEETKLRDTFRSTDVASLTPHVGLISLFSPDNGLSLPLTYNPPESNDSVIMTKHTTSLLPGQVMTVESLSDFRANYNRAYPNILNRLEEVLDQDPVVIAGGSVLRSVTPESDQQNWGDQSDVDIFVYHNVPDEANRIARRIFHAVAVDNERWVIMRTRGVITLQQWLPDVRMTLRVGTKLQIILRLYASPAEVLLGFDCDSCCCAFDGRSVWVTPRWVYAIRRAMNTLNPLHSWPNKASYELRLCKYAFRGFAVYVPGLDEERIDYQKIRTEHLKDLKGLARLLKMSMEMESSTNQESFAPRSIPALRRDVINDLAMTNAIITGSTGGYDEDLDDVIIPSDFCHGEPNQLSWLYCDVDDFPLARDIRVRAWWEIENGNDTTQLLRDAWDREKRSREYLNATMDKYSLDKVYYGHAYKDVS